MNNDSVGVDESLEDNTTNLKDIDTPPTISPSSAGFIPNNSAFSSNTNGFINGSSPFTAAPIISEKEQTVTKALSDKNQKLFDKISQKEQKLLTPEELELKNIFSELQQLNQQTIARQQNQESALVSDELMRTPLGKALNLGVAAASNVGDIARNIVATPARLARNTLEKELSPEQIAAYRSATEKNQLRAQYDQELDRLIKTPASSERDAAITELTNKLQAQRLTPEEQAIFEQPEWDNIYESDQQRIADKVYASDQLSGFLESIEDQTKKSKDRISTKFSAPATKKLKKSTDQAAKYFESGEYLEGTASFLNGLKNLATEDTYAAVQTFSESLPYMIGMVVASPVVLPTEVIRLQDSSIQAFKEEYGELPNTQERQLIGLLSGVGASLDKISAGVTAKSASLAKSIISSSKTLNQRLPKKLITALTTVGAPVGSIILEGATEGTQNVLEQVAGTVRDPKVDLSSALVDAAYGATGGAIFSAPNVASELIQGVNTVSEPIRETVKSKVDTASTKVRQALVTNTDEFIANNKNSDPKAVADRIVEDGIDSLDADTRVERITELVKLKDKIRAESTEVRKDDEGNPIPSDNYSEVIDAFIDKHQDLVRKETTNKSLKEHIQDSVESSDSINEVASAINNGADLPLKTLERVSGSTAFKEASDSAKDTIKTLIKFKKNLSTVSNDIINGSKDGKFIGVNQHLSNIKNALFIKDKGAANNSLNLLNKWKNNQSKKIEAYQAAKEEAVTKDVNEIKFQFNNDTKTYKKGVTDSLINTMVKDLDTIDLTINLANKLIDSSDLTTTQDKTKTEKKADEVKSVKRKTVADYISQPLTKDKKVANEKIKALNYVLNLTKDRINTKLSTKANNVIKYLGRVDQLNTNQIERLDKAVNSIYKEIKQLSKTAVKGVDKPKKTTQKDTIEDFKGSYKKNLTQNLLSDSSTTKNLTITKSKLNPEQIQGTPIGFKAKDVFKSKTVTKSGFFNEIHNFFSTYSKEGFTKDMISKVGKVSETEKELLNELLSFHNKFSKQLEKSISFLDETNFIYPESIRNGKNVLSSLDQNPLGYLIKENEKGNRYLNENLIGLMSTVMYEWLGTKGTDTLYNTDANINSILQRDSNYTVEPFERDALATVGNTQVSIATTLGQAVVKQLGLTQTELVDGNMTDRLALSIGLTIIAAAVESNYLVPTKVNLSDYIDSNLRETSRPTTFLRINTQKDNIFTPINSVLNIKEQFNKNKETRELFNKLFGLESFQVFPTTSPVKKTPKYLKGTFQKVPNKLNKFVKAKQNTKWFIKNKHSSILNKLGRDTFESIAGVDTETVGKHITEITKQEAVNEDIKRTIDNYLLTLDQLEDTKSPIYFQYEVYKQHRSGIVNNMLNPVSSKIARHLVSAESWNVTIKPDDIKAHNNFKLAVAQAFGFKIETHKLQDSLNKFNELINDPVVIKAVEVIKQVSSTTELNSAQKQRIMAAVKLGGENLHTFDALVALSNYSSVTSFNTDLAIEVDGVTNGLAIGFMQSGSTNLLKSVGVYIEEGKDINYPNWASNPSNLDLYKRLASDWIKQLNLLMANSPKNINAIQITTELVGSFIKQEEIDGKVVNIISKLGRDLSKPSLLFTSYGASVNSAVREISTEFVDKIHTKLGKASAIENSRERKIETKKIVDGISSIIGQKIVDVDFDKPQEIVLGGEVLEKFKSVITETYGVALRKALNNSFPEFKKFTNALGLMTNAAYEAFNIKYERELKKERKAKNGRVLSQKEKQNVFDRLKRYQPSFKSALSKSVEDSLLPLDIEDKIDYKDKKTVVQISLPNSKRFDSNSIQNRVSERVYAAPGARGHVYGIQSQDAAIQALSGLNYDFLDVFDAKMLSLLDVDQATSETNETFWDVTTNYSLFDAVYESYKRLMIASKGDNQIRQKIKESINSRKEEEDHLTINQFNKEMFALKNKIKEDRKKLKSEPNVVIGQYAHLEDSTYVANETVDKAQSDKEIDKAIDKLLEDMVTETKNNQSGSSIDPIDFDNFNSIFDQNLNSNNTLTVFDVLGNYGNKPENNEHRNRLKEVLNNVVNKVLRPTDSIEFKLGEVVGRSHGAAKGEKVYVNASTANRLNNNNEMSMQEIQVHELVHVVLNYGIDKNREARRELIKLFNQTKAHIKNVYGNDGWKIFLNNNESVQIDEDTEIEAAKERYNYIFNNSKVQNVPTKDPLTGKTVNKNSNDYLKEFVAFGLTNEKFINLLSQIKTKGKNKTNLTLWEKLERAFNSLLEWIGGRIVVKDNIGVDTALRNLVDHIASVESKQRSRAVQLLQSTRDPNLIAAKLLKNKIVEPFINWRLDPTRVSTSKAGKVLDAIALLPISYNNTELRKKIKRVLRSIKLVEENLLVKLVREIQGNKLSNNAWHTLLRQSKHLVDAARKDVSTNIQQYLRDSFQGEVPNVEESKALTRVIYKGDLSVLIEDYSLNDLSKLLTDDKKVKEEIDKLETQLDQFGSSNKNYYINQSKGLGKFMAKGIVVNTMQALNAYNIANFILDIRDTSNTVVNDANLAETIIDRLASLYSLQEMPADNKTMVAKVIDRETANNNQDNGIISILNLHRNFKQQSLNDLFNGNKVQTVKGYIHETFNPRTDIKVGTYNNKEDLLRQGYVPQGKELTIDIKDPNQTPRELYVLKDAVGNVYQKSIVSLTNKNAMGTTLLDGYIAVGSLAPKREATIAKNQYINSVKSLVNNQFNSDTVFSASTKLLPLIDDQGNVVDFRYVMSEHNKISLLERDDRFDTVLGNMYGSIKDKLNTKEVNKKVVELAYDDWTSGFTNDPNSFVKINKNSEEERYRELYALMPKDMKQSIRDIWGTDEIVIRRELADLIFGYRKWSITHAFEKSPNRALKRINELLNKGIVRHIEAIWQEVVSVAKTNIVIRTPPVLIANVISNGVLSLVKGVPVTYMFKQQASAINELNLYQKELRKRNQLQIKLDTDTKLTKDQQNRLKVRIARLDDNLTNNPVSSMIDEGVFQAITEDLEDNRSPYNFRDKLLTDLKLDKLVYSDKKVVRDSIQQAFMTEETSIFKLLMKATQYSDFIARYALHKYNTEERLIEDSKGNIIKGMDPDDSLRDVIETFINYDIPTSKELQYMNDMGFLMFTKFMFRIQKVIFNLLKDRPISTGISLLTQQVFMDVPDILDSLGGSLDGRAGFILGPLDTATNISGLENMGELVGY